MEFQTWTEAEYKTLMLLLYECERGSSLKITSDHSIFPQTSLPSRLSTEISAHQIQTLRILMMSIPEDDNVPIRVAAESDDIRFNIGCARIKSMADLSRTGTGTGTGTKERLLQLFQTLDLLPIQLIWLTPQYSPASITTV